MPEKPALPTYDWTIRTKQDPTQRVSVHAAYHAQESDFVVFKDGQHKTIYMIAVDQVLDIGRLDPERREVGPDGRLTPPTKET
jgi:hypothetical protein